MDLQGAEIRNFPGIILRKEGFGSHNYNIVTIPHYQRPYRWTTELVSDLIKDWEHAGSRYFAGSIVTVVSDQNRRFELIDGQQRFTTIYLINFIRFLLLRVMAKECCIQMNLFRSHDKILENLILSQNFLLENNNNLDNYLSNISNNDDYSEDDNLFLKNYVHAALLPQKKQENDEGYIDEHYEKLKQYFDKSDLLLFYNRDYFNSVLKEVLASTCIKMSSRNKPELVIREINADDDIKENAKTYIQAIETIFKTFCDIVNTENEKDGLSEFFYAQALTNKITDFLNSIQLCVIETGNPDDAYTLFETLNERSLALDNLDLIKNQFFKKFVESNHISDTVKNKGIEELDSFWNQEIFKGTGKKEKSLITFLAIAYITGNNNISPKQTDKNIREALKTYLTEYNSQNPYTLKLAIRDFNIFKACALILKNSGTRYKAEADMAYRAAYEKNSTILEKCIHLIRGANQDTILAGLFSTILNHIRLKENEPNFSPYKVNDLSNKYLKKELPENLSKPAFDLWKMCIKAKTHTKALDHSWLLLDKNSLKSREFTACSIGEDISKKLDEDFSDWLKTWSFGKNYKLRMLFARCFQLRLNENNTLSESDFIITPKILELDIDHMEPLKVNHNHEDSYFQDIDRESIINQLGNMMILTSSSNRRKSNAPMESVFTALEKINLSDHFISKKTKDLLEQEGNYIKSKDGNRKVPTINYFNERKKFLIDIFMKAVNVPFS